MMLSYCVTPGDWNCRRKHQNKGVESSFKYDFLFFGYLKVKYKSYLVQYLVTIAADPKPVPTDRSNDTHYPNDSFHLRINDTYYFYNLLFNTN